MIFDFMDQDMVRNTAARLKPHILPGLLLLALALTFTIASVRPSQAVPEMDVSGNGNPITSGAGGTSVTNDTDFGSQDITTGSNANIFTITNTGNTNLSLTNNPRVSIVGGNSGDFTVTTDASTPVLPFSGTTTFTITFNPTTTGLRSTTISIANDDSNENPYTFTIQGTGTTPAMVVSGNATNINDNDTTPSVADDTDFGRHDIVTDSNVNTFTITNNGTGALSLTGTPRVNISGTNAGDFTVTAVPGTPIASGGNTTTFDITFDPSDIGARTATVTIANDDPTANPYNFDIRGEGKSTGTILIMKNTSPQIAGDGTFTYNSSAAQLDGLSITTTNNTGSSAAVTINENSFTVTENKSTGWVLADISCTGDTDNGSTVDIANRTVTVDLDTSETIVCIFTSTRDSTFAVTRAQRIIANFMTNRADQITASSPGLVGRLDNNSVGTTTTPFGFSGNGTISNNQGTFSTSLRQIIGARDTGKAKRRKELTQLMALGQQVLALPEDTMLPGFDIWLQGKWAHIEGDTRDSDIGIAYIGADYRLSSTLLVGLMLQLDWTDEKDTTQDFAARGQGWMVGPYIVTRFHENLTLSAQLAWGRSNNKISPLGNYTDSFATERFMARGTLTGNFEHNNWRLSPHVAVIYFEEDQIAYTDSLGNFVPGQTISLGRMTFGPEIAYSWQGSDGTRISPHIGIKGIWDFEQAKTVNLATGLTADSEDLRARVEGGLSAQIANGWSIRGQSFYGGIGVQDLETYGGTLTLRIPLN